MLPPVEALIYGAHKSNDITAGGNIARALGFEFGCSAISLASVCESGCMGEVRAVGC